MISFQIKSNKPHYSILKINDSINIEAYFDTGLVKLPDSSSVFMNYKQFSNLKLFANNEEDGRIVFQVRINNSEPIYIGKDVDEKK